MRFLLGMVFTLVTGTAILLFGWDRPPIAFWRQQRELQSCQRDVQRYVDGRETLDVAAHRVAATLLRLQKLEMHTYLRGAWWDFSPKRTIIDYYDSPISCVGDLGKDRRNDELLMNAFRLMASQGEPRIYSRRVERYCDSVITARGYRRVQ